MTQEEMQQAIEKLKDLWETSQIQEVKAFAYELLENPEIKEDLESLARVYNSLGLVYDNLSDYPKALEYYSKSVQISEEIGNKVGVANSLGNIGLVYRNLSDNSKALEYYTKALHLDEELENKNGIARHLGSIGSVYLRITDYQKALEYFSKALQINEEIGNKVNIATYLGNIGLVYSKLSDFPNALEYYLNALQINEKIGNKKHIASNLGNIGLVYFSLSDYPKGLEYLSKALKIDEEIGNKRGIAIQLENIGNVYAELSDYPNALEYHSKALNINQEIGYKDGIGSNLGNIGIIYWSLSDYPKALEYLSKALQIDKEIGNKAGIARHLGNIGIIYWSLSDYPKAIEFYSKALLIDEEIVNKRGIAISLVNLGNVYSTKESTYYVANKAKEYLQKALQLAEEIGLKEVIKDVYEHFHTLCINEKQYEEALEYYKKSVEIEKEIQSEEAKNKAVLFDQRRKIEEDEKARLLKLARFKEQERIFHNILPVSIANRLIEGEQTIAESFENVSIFFSDIVGFTTLSSNIEPAELVKGLNTIFTAFDRIGTIYGLEKIKTIGDAYMAVCGVPTEYENHALRTANFAIEAIEVINSLELGEEFKNLQIRIGLHSGSVVAGIIGEKKFAYDVWGDAVNVASRMESYSEAGRIHISEAFAKSIENNPEFSLIPRGEITVKGKGTMNTFWLEKGI
ncbi:MAG: tetratricopeptide repeat protein [Candidatus Kapabacteria bacterium]|nr:tetratricopeptide repeat protein [Candidatus Kapabacteria bacterium]